MTVIEFEQVNSQYYWKLICQCDNGLCDKIFPKSIGVIFERQKNYDINLFTAKIYCSHRCSWWGQTRKPNSENQWFCIVCKQWVPKEQMENKAVNLFGVGSHCKNCRRKKESQSKHKYRRKNITYLRKYGISLDEAENQWLSQNKKCGLCKKTLQTPKTDFKLGGANKTVIDHNHRTGKWAILCDYCNISRVGMNTADNLKQLIKYIEFRDNPDVSTNRPRLESFILET